MKAWDAHNHWMPPEVAEKTTFYKEGWSDLEALLRALDKAAVEKAILLYPTSDAHLNLGGWSGLCTLYNRALAAKVKKHPDRLIGAGILPLDRPDALAAALREARELGLSCLSLPSSCDGAYLEEPRFLPIFEEAGRLGLPLFVHAQVINPIGFERVKDPLLMPVVEYLFDLTICAGAMMMSGRLGAPGAPRIVFAHFGGVLPFLAGRFDATYSMLRSRNLVKDLGGRPSAILKNIFADTSGASSPAMLKLALEFFGAGRILWGSDYPANRDPTAGLEAVRSLDISEQEKEMMLAENCWSLFN